MCYLSATPLFAVPRILRFRGDLSNPDPISGVPAARGATLTFMVGGPAEHFPAAQSLLQAMGKNIVHCGDVGTGQSVKICNNMMLAISMIGAAETMNLGTRWGTPRVWPSFC